jgi:cytochrome P450
MTAHKGFTSTTRKQSNVLSLYHLLNPEILANPYPLYNQLRTEDPVHWDPFLHAWVVTLYADVISVFKRFLTNRTPTAEQLTTLGLEKLTPHSAAQVIRSLEEMIVYFRAAVRENEQHPREGLINALMIAEQDGDRLSEDEGIASTIVTMVGGQETTTNLIGNGILTLLRYPDQLAKLCSDLSLIPSAFETVLRRMPALSSKPGQAPCHYKRKHLHVTY